MTTDHEPADIEQRATVRVPLETAISVRERGGHKLPATLTNLSCGGVRIKGVCLERNADHDIWVRIPGLESLPSRMRWAEDGASGLMFERALHPAVFQRIVSLNGNGGAPGPELAHASDEPAFVPGDVTQRDKVAAPIRPSASRREQIRAGYVIPDPGMLLEKKPVEGGKSIFTLVRRNTVRMSDHRAEMRFAAPPEMDLVVDHANMAMKIANVSSSGLMLADDTRREIGDPVEVRFSEFAPIEGSIVWKRAGSFGIALPAGSIDLTEAA